MGVPSSSTVSAKNPRGFYRRWETISKAPLSQKTSGATAECWRQKGSQMDTAAMRTPGSLASSGRKSVQKEPRPVSRRMASENRVARAQPKLCKSPRLCSSRHPPREVTVCPPPSGGKGPESHLIHLRGLLRQDGVAQCSSPGRPSQPDGAPSRHHSPRRESGQPARENLPRDEQDLASERRGPCP